MKEKYLKKIQECFCYCESCDTDGVGKILEELILEYNEWLHNHGYVDFDIISEFEIKDFAE